MSGFSPPGRAQEEETMFRSADMSFVRIIMHQENARPTLRALGRFGKLHLVDTNTDEPTSVSSMDLRRSIITVQSHLRRLAALRAAARRLNIPLPTADTPLRSVSTDRDASALFASWAAPIEEEISQHQAFLMASRKDIARLTEFIHVTKYAIRASSTFIAPSSSFGPVRSLSLAAGSLASPQPESPQAGFDDDDEAWMHSPDAGDGADGLPMRPLRPPASGSLQSLAASSSSTIAAALAGGNSDVSVSTMYGLVPVSTRPTLERMLARAARGNLIFSSSPLSHPTTDPSSLESVRKCVFSVLVPPGSRLPSRVRRIAAALGATLYTPPAVAVAAAGGASPLARLRKERRARVHAVAQTRRALRRAVYTAVWGVMPSSSHASSEEGGEDVDNATDIALSRHHQHRARSVQGSALLSARPSRPSSRTSALASGMGAGSDLSDSEDDDFMAASSGSTDDAGASSGAGIYESWLDFGADGIDPLSLPPASRDSLSHASADYDTLERGVGSVFDPVSPSSAAASASSAAVGAALIGGLTPAEAAASLVPAPLKDWHVAMQHEAALLAALGLARGGLGGRSVSVAGWVPSKDLPALKRAVADAVGPQTAASAAAASAAAGAGASVGRPGRNDDLDGVGNASVPAAVVQELPPRAAGCPDKPPTLIETNSLTAVPQSVVDTYGIPRYQEVNPGLFTVVTFPFLFGVMYGDIFHGLCLLLAGAVLVGLQARNSELQRQGKLGGALAGLHSARWMVLMMGAFACYMGFVYNDCASVPLRIFQSHFGSDEKAHGGPLLSDGGVYPFGVDPAWYHSVQELPFLNSFKMKMAVILGVIHMTLGIVLGAYNHIQFKTVEGIFLETIPRCLFMLSTFGYMIFIIFYKWTVDWAAAGMSPPNLIQTMIEMFLAPGSVSPDQQLYPGQTGIQLLLVLIAALCLPFLFLGPPLYRRWQWTQLHPHASRRHTLASDADEVAGINNARARLLPTAGAGGGIQHPGYDALTDPSDEEDWGSDGGSGSALLGASRRRAAAAAAAAATDGHPGHAGGAGEDEEGGHTDPHSLHYSFSDDLIHQGIHGIEFVLGAVSNTASYLRLWALSLAHAQLSSVFWSKMLVDYGIMIGPVATVVGVGVWAGATAGVLLGMDALECFLHALRLHWVEFQSKFYTGTGIAFAPFVLATGEDMAAAETEGGEGK